MSGHDRDTRSVERGFDGLASPLALIDHCLATLAAVAIFVIMIIVTLDVLLRYIFNAPLAWSFDLISIYLMSGAFFLALSDTLRRAHHGCVDIFYLNLPLKARRILKVIAWALSSVLFACITVLAALAAFDRWDKADVVAGVIEWPTWIPAAVAALGFGVMTLRLALGTIAVAARLAGAPVALGTLVGQDVIEHRPGAGE